MNRHLPRLVAAVTSLIVLGTLGTLGATSPAGAAPPDPYVTPVPSRMPTFSAVVMAGSAVYRDGTRIETGIEDVATYVNLRGELLVATTDGRLVSWRTGRTREVGRFKPRVGVRLVADRTSRYAAIVRGTCDRGRQHVRVYDRREREVVLAGFPRMTDCSRLALDSEALYYPRGESVVRLDLETGEERVLVLDDAEWFEDVVAEHLVLFRPGGAYVRPVDDLASGGRLSLAADHVSPNLHWSAGLEQGLTIDNTTRTPVRPVMRVPGWRRHRVDVHGWVGPDTIAYAATRKGGRRVALYECDATQSTCERVVAAPTRHLVEPGGWLPGLGE